VKNLPKGILLPGAARQHLAGLSVLARVIHAYPTQASAIKMATDACAKSRMELLLPGVVDRPEWPAE
jgi:hypothetical protein